MAGGASRSK
jgi:hypothetical protein